MGYRREGDKVTLEMTAEEYDQLLMLLGFGLGALGVESYGKETFYSWLGLVNRLNAGNPNFKPYEVPSDSV